MSRIYKIVPAKAWEAAKAAGLFTGSPVDLADGYIHFSAAHQVAETLRRHFAGQEDLVMLAVDAAALGADLVWEPSRGGDLFPHLFGPLKAADVIEVLTVPLDGQGGRGG